ncbi:MAG: hypothetical protein M3069_15315 [Chloroflexota bacterium]|nr:hypothetical protein [Chloroflexota bacterium]
MSSPRRLACVLDEDLDPALAEALENALDWTVTSVRAEGWLGIKNGSLLEAMAEAHMAVLVTGDRGLYGQRRSQLVALQLGVVLVRDPARAAERIYEIARAIDVVQGGQLVEVAGA